MDNVLEAVEQQRGAIDLELAAAAFERGRVAVEDHFAPIALEVPLAPAPDALFIDVVADPANEFGTKAFKLALQIVTSDDTFAQGLLVLPKDTPMYRFADEIRTAALFGVLVQCSPDDSLESGARALYASYLSARDALDSQVADFSASMQQRKLELLSDPTLL